MATKQANKRLLREYENIQKASPPYITAHPSEHNILEWHYLLEGAPNTSYEGGQYHGTLIFPSDYPFAPPAIRMHTPNGRFQPSTRLCLSISDFHPKSFNPAWSVSTILIGLMSFMNGEEMTAGSINGTVAERRWYAARSRWWNSTGGGSASSPVPGVQATTRGIGSINGKDGGAKFRFEWPEVDVENWKWIKDNRIDPSTGRVLPDPEGTVIECSPEAAALRRRLGRLDSGVDAVVHGGQAARDAGRGFMARNKALIFVAVIVVYVLLTRVLGGDVDL